MEYSKNTNICLIGISEWDVKEKVIESIFKAIMSDNFWNLGREIDIQIKAQKTLNRVNPNKATPRHIIIVSL